MSLWRAHVSTCQPYDLTEGWPGDMAAIAPDHSLLNHTYVETGTI